MFRKLCGERALKDVVLVTNMRGEVISEQGTSREQEHEDGLFGPAIHKGAQLCHHYNTPESARTILRKILENQPVVLEIQRELIDEGKAIGQTEAGVELHREIREMVEKSQKEIGELEEEIQSEKGEGYQKELEKKRRVEEEVEKRRKGSAEMDSKFEEARCKIEGRIRWGFGAQRRRVQEAYEAEIQIQGQDDKIGT